MGLFAKIKLSFKGPPSKRDKHLFGTDFKTKTQACKTDIQFTIYNCKIIVLTDNF